MRVDKRPKSQSSWGRYKPATHAARYKLRGKCGDACFLLPGGTPARPGVPAYPICSSLEKVGNRCVLSCPGMEAAYKRLMLGIAHYKYSPNVKRQMQAAARKVVEMALKYADPRDPSNTCNWALRASKRGK